ncbi:MMPL family transporter [Sporolactobacillus inulinus]|uniref:Membrane protein n=1 Tax=Sporolactobacillus inulinus CASD TaxID=1069536 RepID=A0A0U1QPA6_9BACL|nr:MMPL family transporter [Sporolactobacillus inulinus]KLI02612.1 membrane protein [Sporolactobacillus inulinus CASD]GEB76728.1 transporter [Sporolactobacillus inulinus]
MKKVIKLRWVLLAIWVVGLAALIITQPNMNQLVRDKGGYALPNDYSSSVAGRIEKQFNGDQNTTSYIAVFHSDQGLSDKKMDHIKETLQKIRADQKDLHINNVVDSFEQTDLKSQLVANNNKTLMAVFQVENTNDVTVHQLRAKMDTQIKTEGVKTYLTGQELINDDMSTSAEAGLQKTEWITVVFILVVLLLVFRSLIAPFIPLVTVGISYIVAQSVVAFLIKYFDFPVSNFTQIFMVAIMFGIGTDYCILLMSRFKEELAKGKDKTRATQETFRTAGKTVLHSGIPVFIAFLSLAFVQFSLYRSAIAVGVGVIFLLLALFTLLPLFMSTLGKQLFWPMVAKIKEPKSPLWAGAGNLAFTRPLIALLIVAAFLVPPILTYNGQLSFNSPEELPDHYAAKEGFDVVSNDFGPGNISPATIYLKNDDNMKTTDYIALIERISTELKTDANVSKVMSISRPLGDRLNDIYVAKQSQSLHNGLSDASDGLGTLQKSLNDTSKKIDASQPQLAAVQTGADKLQVGTNDTKKGVQDLQSALAKISDGIKKGSSGTGEIRTHVHDAQKQLAQLQTGQQQLQNGYQKVAQSLKTLSDQLGKFSSGSSAQPAIDTTQLKKTLAQIQSGLQAYAAAHPEAMRDPNFRTMAAGLQKLPDEMNQLQSSIQSEAAKQSQAAQGQISQLNKNIQALADGMNTLNAQSAKVSDGLSAFKSGLAQLDTGLAQLENGLNQASNGQAQVIANTPKITNALTQIASGQEKLKNGFSDVQDQMKDLSSGLSEGANGTNKIQGGLQSANKLVGSWSKLPYDQSGIYVPEQIFNDKDFKTALDQYMSNDGKITTIQVTMKEDPYTNKGIADLRNLKKELPSILKGTKLENAQIGVSGIASVNSDLKQLVSSDYQKAVTFVIIGVFIALVIVLRSLSMPIYLMASLLLTYFASMGFTELIFTKLFHFSGLTWTTQFFGFIVLVALGIDYSIFVMTRFNEYANQAIKERMLLTLWHMGSVIFSAVLILSGTFAAMMPSGMLSLVEISTVVIIGLVLYAAILIPLFIPIMVKLLGRGNWWPFMERPKKSVPLDDSPSI